MSEDKDRVLDLCGHVEDEKRSIAIQTHFYKETCYWRRGGPVHENVPARERDELKRLRDQLIPYTKGHSPEAGVFAYRGLRVVNRFIHLENQEELWQGYLANLRTATGPQLEVPYTLFSYNGPLRERIPFNGKSIHKDRFTAVLAHESTSGMSLLRGKTRDIEEIMQTVPESRILEGIGEGLVPVHERLSDLEKAGLLPVAPEAFLEILNTKEQIPIGRRTTNSKNKK